MAQNPRAAPAYPCHGGRGPAGATLAKWNSRWDQNAQFSLPYVMSTVAFQRRFMIDGFKPAMRAREDIRRLVANVTAEVDPTVGTMDARITVRLHDGREFSMLCDDCKGTPTMPLTDAEWRRRFRDLCTYSAHPISPQAAEKLVNRLFTLEQSADMVKDIVLPLTPH